MVNVIVYSFWTQEVLLVGGVHGFQKILIKFISPKFEMSLNCNITACGLKS